MVVKEANMSEVPNEAQDDVVEVDEVITTEDEEN